MFWILHKDDKSIVCWDIFDLILSIKQTFVCVYEWVRCDVCWYLFQEHKSKDFLNSDDVEARYLKKKFNYNNKKWGSYLGFTIKIQNIIRNNLLNTMYHVSTSSLRKKSMSISTITSQIHNNKVLFTFFYIFSLAQK